MSELADQEIRKCNLQNIILALEGTHWKKLISHIPKNLDSENFVPKYDSDHITIISNASIQQKRPCTELLFEEWGTSGRRRPTIKDLLKILINAELYRAADIVSVEMLKGSPVKRPQTGPAAKIDVSITRLMAENEMNEESIENFLDNMSYPSSVGPNMNTFDKNIDQKHTKPVSEEVEKYKNFKLNFLSNQNSYAIAKSQETNVTNSFGSDMIKFSSDQVNFSASDEIVLPAFSKLGIQISKSDLESDTTSNNIIPTDSNIDFKESSASITCDVEAVNQNILPKFLDESTDSAYSYSEANIPNFSMINENVSEDIPALSILNQGTDNSADSEDFNLPIVSALQSSEPNASDTKIIRHFEYDELSEATMSFNDDDFSGDLNGRKIGSGGFSTVYLAKKSDGSLFVVKRLCHNNIDRKTRDMVQKQFNIEIETLSTLSHENIVSFFGYSNNGPYPCLVYEYVDGGNLQENILRNVDFKASKRLNVAIGLARGLEYLHCSNSKPFIHRDVKSANILLTKTFIPKLCDFGLIRPHSETTNTTNIIGTAGYMAPEMFSGDISEKIDVFSFGVVLLELLTSLPPTDKDREADLITHVSDNGINILLDASVGPWYCVDELYSIAQECLEDKRKRPIISDVISKLSVLLSK